MRPALIVIPSPSFDLLLCFVDGFEPVRVEAFGVSVVIQAWSLDFVPLDQLANGMRFLLR